MKRRRLIETLRDQQPRFVELGLVASHLGVASSAASAKP